MAGELENSAEAEPEALKAKKKKKKKRRKSTESRNEASDVVRLPAASSLNKTGESLTRSSSCPAIGATSSQTSKSNGARAREAVKAASSLQQILPRALTAPKHRKLRVGIFNACRSWYHVHPGAASCMVSLTQTPWFYSKAVAQFLHARPTRDGSSGAPVSLLPPVEAFMVQAEDLQAGRVLPADGERAGFDVLVFPGGSTEADLNALGRSGCEAVRKFVQSGGGYCGVCAGAFLGLHLELLQAERCTRDAEGEKKAERDPFMVKACFTKIGRRLLWSEGRSHRKEHEESKDGSVRVRYHNGPLLQVPKASPAKVLCRMSSTPDAECAPAALNGSAAVLMQNVGSGRAIIISPHPESTQDSLTPEPGKVRLRRILQRAVLLAAAGNQKFRWMETECHRPGP